MALHPKRAQLEFDISVTGYALANHDPPMYLVMDYLAKDDAALNNIECT